ncbi:DUF4232 domain-containing protein [Kribbella sp. NPDC048928]|uniref:DUF4232 domain-containing protein n=1 Tax=Kribbella sp. NPDC048928 TaxID=3364111 RepID=UPI00371DC782
MNRQGWARLLGRLMLLGGLVLVSGCGTESAVSGGVPGRTPDVATPRTPGSGVSAERRPTPSPTPTPPPRTCPASGAQITVGPVDAALGHRAVVVKLTNCRSTPINLNGYPGVTVLDARRKPMKVTVAHGISYMAIDPGPTRIRLSKGETALAAVSWSSTVEVAEDKASGTYLDLAPRAGNSPVTWPVDTDLGTTAKVTLTAWCLKFPN